MNDQNAENFEHFVMLISQGSARPPKKLIQEKRCRKLIWENKCTKIRQMVGIIRIQKDVRLYCQVLSGNKGSNIAEDECGATRVIMHGT